MPHIPGTQAGRFSALVSLRALLFDGQVADVAREKKLAPHPRTFSNRPQSELAAPMADSSNSHDNLGFRVLQSIRRILRRVSSYSPQVGRETGLSVPYLLCLRAIAEDDAEEVTRRRVAEATHLSPSTVSTIAEKLVRAELVTRMRSDRDRRRVHLSLTPLGHQRLRDFPRPLEERFLSRLMALPAQDREHILEVLEQVVQMMDAEQMDAAPILVPGTDIRPE